MARNGMKEVMEQIKKPPRRLGRPDAAINAAKFRVGRCQLACRRAFIASNGRPLSTYELLAYAFPRSKAHAPWQRCLVFVLTDCRGYQALNADGQPLGLFAVRLSHDEES